MKEHYLGKGVGETLLGSKDTGYSVYKNPNAELREKIKNYKPDQTKVTMGWPAEKTWDIIEWEDKEVKCQSGRNTNYFPIKEVEKALAEQEELQRNIEFPAYKYFKDAFGIVSSIEKWEGGKKITILDLQSHISIGRDYSPTSVEHYNYEYEGELRFDDDMKVEFSKGCNMMSIYFNKDGDYMNRDYNVNLNQFKCKEENLGILLSELKKKILALGEVAFFRGNFYVGKNKMEFFTNREDHELRKEFAIGYQALEVKSLPKKCEYKPASEMWNQIEKNIPEDIYEIFRITNEILV
jgi:hypothetical protein